MYYEFEFASKAKTYIRYALAAATVGNGELPACCFQSSPLLAHECCIGAPVAPAGSRLKSYSHALAAALGKGSPHLLPARIDCAQRFWVAPAQCFTPVLSVGKFYVLQTGCNEKRWSKMKENLTTVVKSFQVEDRSVCLAVQLLTPLELARVLAGS